MAQRFNLTSRGPVFMGIIFRVVSATLDHLRPRMSLERPPVSKISRMAFVGAKYFPLAVSRMLVNAVS